MYQGRQSAGAKLYEALTDRGSNVGPGASYDQPMTSTKEAEPTRSRVDVLGCPIDPVTLVQAVATVEEAIGRSEAFQQVSINAAKLVRYQQDQSLRTAVDACDLITADGQSVVWAARLLGRPLPERVAGIDLMDALFAAAAQRDHRVFLLGARPAVLEDAERAIVARFPGIEIAGRHHGYFTAEEEPDVVRLIEDARPDMLFIALETPAKELFLGRHRGRLGVPFTMGVGGAFDVLAGGKRRAPRVLRRAGLEWLFRLVQDPRRLARRYVVGNSRFIWLVAQAFVRERRLRGG